MTTEQEVPVPMGAVALLHAPDVEQWSVLHHTLAEFSPRLHAEVFDASGDDWRFLLPLPPETRALVLGCGWGRLAAALAPLCERVYAVDADPACARFTNARAFAESHPNLLGIAAPHGVLPFSRASFHLIVLQDPGVPGASDLWRNRLADVVRLRALLAPGGMLLIGPDVTHGSVRRWRGTLGQAGFRHVEALVAAPGHSVGSWTFWTGPGMRQAAALAALARRSWNATTPAGRTLGGWRRMKDLASFAWRCSPRVWLLATVGGAPSPSICRLPNLPEGEWDWMVRGGGLWPGDATSLLAVDRRTGRVGFVVKVARDRSAEAGVLGEHEALERLHSTVSASLRANVPAPVARLTVHGLAASVQACVDAPSLAECVRDAPGWRRPQVAARLLSVGVQWLISFHRETAHEEVVTEAMLEALLFADLERDLERCEAAPRRRDRFLALRQRARRLSGERVPLVCEHGSFTGGNVLLAGHAAFVAGWGFARFGALPLADLYDLIHSLASILAERSAEPLPSEAILRTAYGDGTFGRAAGEAVRLYCASLKVHPEWGRLLVPARLVRTASLHAERFALGEANRWLAAGCRYLEAAESFPSALGHL